jgi:hypothetical protein
MHNGIIRRNNINPQIRFVVCLLAVSLCALSGCSQNNEINPGTKLVEQENGDVWIYSAGPTYVDEDMRVTVSFPEDYWSSILLIKPDDSILNVYYREVKENEPLLTNGAVLATIIVTNKSDETENNWAKAVGTEYFAETEAKNYYVSVQAGDIKSDVSDKDMLKNLSTYVEENINKVFTIIQSD